MFKVYNKRLQLRRSGVFIVNFEYVSYRPNVSDVNFGQVNAGQESLFLLSIPPENVRIPEVLYDQKGIKKEHWATMG